MWLCVDYQLLGTLFNSWIVYVKTAAGKTKDEISTIINTLNKGNADLPFDRQVFGVES